MQRKKRKQVGRKTRKVAKKARGTRGKARAGAGKRRQARRSYREIFTDELAKLSDGGKRMVPNPELRQALDWDETRYASVKSLLVSDGAVTVGRGQGGTIGLSTGTTGGKGLSVFVSYSHLDEDLKNEVVKHLDPLRRKYGIEAWHDRKLKAGDDWEKRIDANLKKARIVLLLVSIDFINSKYCYDVELESAMERHEKGDATVVPIILRACSWQTSPFAKLQALPKDGKAVTAWPNRDEALTTVAESLRILIDDILSRG